MDNINPNRRIKDYLKIKKSVDYSTLERFFNRMPTDMFERIMEIIIDEENIQPTNPRRKHISCNKT